jgi:hypothetical protein
MARSEPTIIMSACDDDKYFHICKATGVYAVVLDGKPFMLRCDYSDGRSKYPKTVFTSIGSARSAVRRLNRFFKTNRFDVIGIE